MYTRKNHNKKNEESKSNLHCLDSIVLLSASDLKKKTGGSSFDKTMKKIGKDINNSDPYEIY